MEQNDLIKNTIDYYNIQKVFLNSPFKEFVGYIYPLVGYRKYVPDILELLGELSSCDKNYIHHFGTKTNDDKFTVGQLLKIASGMIRYDKAYKSHKEDDIVCIGLLIVDLLVIMPFSLMTDRHHIFEQAPELQNTIKKLRDIKERGCS